MSPEENFDIERQPTPLVSQPSDNKEDYVVAEESLEGESLCARALRLAGKLRIEQRGIERVPENERTDASYWSIGSIVCTVLLTLDLLQT